MRLTYLDESGSSDGFHYIFGALLCDITQAKSIETELDQIGASISRKYPGEILPSTELHAVEIRHGKGFWRQVKMADRFAVLREVVLPYNAPVHSLSPNPSIFQRISQDMERMLFQSTD